MTFTRVSALVPFCLAAFGGTPWGRPPQSGLTLNVPSLDFHEPTVLIPIDLPERLTRADEPLALVPPLTVLTTGARRDPLPSVTALHDPCDGAVVPRRGAARLERIRVDQPALVVLRWRVLPRGLTGTKLVYQNAWGQFDLAKCSQLLKVDGAAAKPHRPSRTSRPPEPARRG